MSTRVATALGHSWEAGLVARIEECPELTVTRRCVDLPELLAAGAAGLADTAVVSSDVRSLDRDSLRHLSVHGVRVVGIIQPGDDRAGARLRHLGLTTVLPHDASAEDLVEALGHTAFANGQAEESEPTPFLPAMADFAPAAPPTAAGFADLPTAGEESPPGRVIAVWGPTGAPGRTTVAVNLAAEMAAAGHPTVLVDADTYGASIGQALSLLDEAPGMAAACRASELGTLDRSHLARLAPEVVPGLRVLTGIPTASRWPELRASAVEQILDLCRTLAAYVVVDCGFGIEDDEELSYDTLAPRRNAATLTALERADDLVVVGAADPVGLQRLVRAVQEVGTVPSPVPRVVVNKVRPSAVGSKPEERIREVLGRFAGLEHLLFVPFEPDTLDAALLQGRAVVEQAPGSSIRAAIGMVADSLLPQEATPQRRRRRRR